jgi:type II secretory ATPase GspE/PulE/Tfp pilus assembly ATPase PilB-like protein/FixJ family two-component response regulator/RNA polymerase subunit RPABC4/transcription elongation factor Spt4
MSRLASLFIDNGPSADIPKAMPGKPQTETVYAVMFVDDEPSVLKAMQRIFRQENYHLLTASSGREALQLLEAQPVHVVVSDHRMPGMTGADLLREVKARWPQTIRIMLTGHADVNAVMGAVNEGAVYKFITKPWIDEDLRLTVSLALERFDLIHSNQTLKKETAAQKKKIKELSRFVDVHRSQIGPLLVTEKLIRQADLDKALATQVRTRRVLPQILLEMNLLDEAVLIKAIQNRFHINRVSPSEFSVPRELASLVPRKVCEKNVLLPLSRSSQGLIVVMADPTDVAKVEDLKFITGMPVKPAVATQAEIFTKIKEVFGESDNLDEILSEIDMTDPSENIEIILEEEDEDTSLEELLRGKNQPPAIRIVNAIISDALRHNASDVHIEPKTKHVMVRYRVDDLLQDKIHIPSAMHLAIVSRIKIMSELDITERRRPQDGRITVKTASRMVDMRISTLPTISGEKVVLRILDKNASARNLVDLGFAEKDYTRISRFIEQPQGILLTTGPTGSGKTTTLYALLRQGARITKNFTTIEDPVEYHMGMAQQVNVREKIGLTFPGVLRSIMRQDPNVIMLGEIRDRETAEVAFHAALTGHLVLSTLHTNNSVASITRLRDIGMKPYVISEALIGVIAQRLLRRICTHCRVPDQPSEETLRAVKVVGMDLATSKGTGCSKCNKSGYHGRLGIYEVFQTDGEIRRMVHTESSESEMMRAARMAGMITLLEDAIDKVGKGLTTCDEIIRVLGPQDTLDIQCRHCGVFLAERFPFCPYCGGTNLPRCQACGTLLAADWIACPSCGHRVPPSGGHERT